MRRGLLGGLRVYGPAKLAVLGEQLLENLLPELEAWRRIPSVVGVGVSWSTGAGLRDPAVGATAVARLVDELVNGERRRTLTRHQYANYVMQHCISLKGPRSVRDDPGSERPFGDFLDINSPNVVEKCLEFGDDRQKGSGGSRCWRRGGSDLKLLLVDPFTDYVVQKVVDLADRDK